MIKQREELEKRTKEHKLLSVTKAYHRDEITQKLEQKHESSQVKTVQWIANNYKYEKHSLNFRSH